VLALTFRIGLRTPLTALRMNAARSPGRAADDTRVAVDRRNRKIDLITGPRGGQGRRAAWLRRRRGAQDRMGFWSALARDPGRPGTLPARMNRHRCPCPVPTLWPWWTRCWAMFPAYPRGTEFAVTMHRVTGSCSSSSPTPGRIGDLAAVLRREAAASRPPPGSAWTSRAGRRVDGRRPKVDSSGLGGAQVQLWLRRAAGGAPAAEAGRGPEASPHQALSSFWCWAEARPECLPDQRFPDDPCLRRPLRPRRPRRHARAAECHRPSAERLADTRADRLGRLPVGGRPRSLPLSTRACTAVWPGIDRPATGVKQFTWRSW